MTIYDSGIRPAITDYLASEQAKIRDYGNYWSASSAGYCYRKLIFERLGVPHVEKEDDARKTRVFEAGHIFHEWVQRITKDSGLSIAQELELQDDDLMVRGHMDDLLLVNGKLILYDYKTQHSGAFTWQKGRPPNHYHWMQVGTYMYMLRRWFSGGNDFLPRHANGLNGEDITEARILKISKDDLRMDENQIFYSPAMEQTIVSYWQGLSGAWDERDKRLPPCTCDIYENGFMAKEKSNPYFYEGKPCSIELYNEWKESNATTKSV